MNLPENYVVICETQKETNIVKQSQEKYKNREENHWAYWKYCTFTNIQNVIEWFKEKNIFDYKIFTFKEWKQMKESKVFPERWCILATKENIKEISDFFVKHTNNNSCYKGNNWINWYFHSHCCDNISIYNHKNFSYCSPYKREEFKEISIEQFKEHILTQPKTIKPYKDTSEVTYEMITTNPYFKTLSGKELSEIIDKMDFAGYTKLDGFRAVDKANNLIKKFNNKTMKLIVPITDVLEIHKIACSTWKNKIASYLTRVDSNQNISFNQIEVDEMFEAATREQKPVLTKIFGEPIKPIEWDKIKTGSKVMIKYTYKRCNGECDYTKPVDVVFYKTKEFITGNNIFKKESAIGSNKYCTFHQDGKFILFGADINTDYITEVIEY